MSPDVSGSPVAPPAGGTGLQRSTFRRQLGLVVTVGVLVIALVSSLVSSWQASRQIRNTLIEQGQRVTQSLATQSTLALLYGAADNAGEAVQTTRAFPDVAGVEVRHASGAVLLSRGMPEDGGPVPTVPQPAPRQAYLAGETGSAWLFAAPVWTRKTQSDSPFVVASQPEELLGEVRVLMSKATLTRMLTNVFLSNMAVSFLFAGLLLLAVRWFTERLMRPLEALSGVMARAEAGESGVRAEVRGARDIGAMAQAFNKMMAALNQR